MRRWSCVPRAPRVCALYTSLPRGECRQVSRRVEPHTQGDLLSRLPLPREDPGIITAGAEGPKGPVSGESCVSTVF